MSENEVFLRIPELKRPEVKKKLEKLYNEGFNNLQAI
jgi:hypothetical protein